MPAQSVSLNGPVYLPPSMTLENHCDFCYAAGGNRGPEVLERTHECDLLLGMIRGKTCKHCFFGGAKKDKTHGIARKASAPGGWLWAIKPVLNPTLPWLCLGNGNQCVHALLTAQSCLDVSICRLQSLTFAY